MNRARKHQAHRRRQDSATWPLAFAGVLMAAFAWAFVIGILTLTP